MIWGIPCLPKLLATSRVSELFNLFLSLFSIQRISVTQRYTVCLSSVGLITIARAGSSGGRFLSSRFFSITPRGCYSPFIYLNFSSGFQYVEVYKSFLSGMIWFLINIYRSLAFYVQKPQTYSDSKTIKTKGRYRNLKHVNRIDRLWTNGAR